MDDLKNKKEIERVTRFLLDKAKQCGADEAEVHASIDNGYTATVRLGQPEEIIYSKDKSIDLTVYFGKRQANVTSNDTTEAALTQLVEKACAMSKYTDEDPHCGLADKEMMATNFPDLDDFYPWHLEPKDAFEMTKRCEQAALAHDKRLTNSEGAWLETSTSFDCYGNSHGLIHVEPSTAHTFGVTVIAKDGEDMEREFDYATALCADDLPNVEEVGLSAAKKTISRLHARSLPTMKVPVAFAPEQSRGLISRFLNAVSGVSLYRKSSFLLDCLGQQVFPDFMHIHEDPYKLRGMGSTPLDNDGLQTIKKDFVKDGLVESYIMGVYSARQLGMQSTANAGGVFNLSVDHTGVSFKELLKQMGKGLLVTDLMGQGINMVNGNYSRGASGFWVENGEIQYPVHEITIAGNMKDMFKNIVAIADDVDMRGNVQTGSILIEEMMVAGAG